MTTMVGVVVSIAAFGAGAVRPELRVDAARQVLDASTVADARLSELEAELQVALDEARRASAAVVAGDDVPGTMVEAAADLLRRAAPAAADAAHATSQVSSVRRAGDPLAAPLTDGVAASEIVSIADQLAASAEGADRFAEMRRRAANVPVALEEALSAIAAGDLSVATAAIATARADHEALAAWEVGLVTLPIWVETSGATIDAVDRLVDAVARGDSEAADAAADDFARLGPDAETADRALRIAISEGGGSVLAAPLSRLVEAMRSTRQQRAEVEALRAAAAPFAYTSGPSPRTP
jgi:hypothetical protein